STPQGRRLRTEVCQNDANLAAIVAVDGSGSVQKSEALLQSEPAAHPDLAFVARWDCNRNSRGDERASTWSEHDIGVDRGAQIASRGPGSRILRELEILPMRKHGHRYDEIHPGIFAYAPALGRGVRSLRDLRCADLAGSRRMGSVARNATKFCESWLSFRKF